VGRAGFMRQGPFIDTPTNMGVTFDWTFPDKGEDKAGPFVGPNMNWTVVSLDSPAPAAGKVVVRNLEAVLQHSPNKGANDLGPPPDSAALDFKNVGQRPVNIGSAALVPHGDTNKDFFTGTVKPDHSVDLNGEHSQGKLAANVSFINFLNHPVNGAFLPSY